MLDDFETVFHDGDTRIHAKAGGSGPPLLLLHGFPQNLWMWARVAPLLAPHFTVVCADLRGYGDSGKPAATPDLHNYSFRQMAEDQVGLMRHLGFERFHVIGHDRGARTAYRMALDHPQRVRSLAVLDIVPTDVMFSQVNAEVARAYWHWYFLQQPSPYPEGVIGGNPDHFYEGCLAGWGATRLDDFDAQQLAQYRRCWRQEENIYGSCADYRAAARVDAPMDAEDRHRRIECASLLFWGSQGLMARLFDMRQVWAGRLANMACAQLPGGHFFVDQFPQQTAEVLLGFLRSLPANT